jgi:hypothetical protein
VTTRWGVFLSGTCVLSAAAGEDARAIPVQEVRRSARLRVIVHDETSDAQDDDETPWSKGRSGSGAMGLQGEARCSLIPQVESKRCVDDRVKGAERHTGTSLRAPVVHD